MYYGIYSDERKAWVYSIDGVSGRCVWTGDEWEAKGWKDRTRAEELAEGVGRVRKMSRPSYGVRWTA
jgi:hypothetical protein